MRWLLFYLSFDIAIQSHAIINTEDPAANLDIDITEAPFALSLRRNDSHICGATIISSNWGITAAHCVLLPLTEANYTVRSGSNYRDHEGSIHSVIKLIKHEQYNMDNSDNDIGLFMVEPEFEFNNATQPIALPSLDGPMQNIYTEYGIAVGWGGYMEVNEDVLSPTLKGVKLPQIRKEECKADYSVIFQVTPRQTCYGYQNGGKDTCKGDSGGPLFNEDYILIGITSWGNECGVPYSPGIYTNVSLYRDWINDVADV